jgi:hypothetical protein
LWTNHIFLMMYSVANWRCFFTTLLAAHVALLVCGAILFNLCLLDFFKEYVYICCGRVCLCVPLFWYWFGLGWFCHVLYYHGQPSGWEILSSLTAFSKTQHNSLPTNYILIWINAGCAPYEGISIDSRGERMYREGDNLWLQAIIFFFMFDFCRIISSIPTAISGAEDIQKWLDISLEVCSAT